MAAWGKRTRARAQACHSREFVAAYNKLKTLKQESSQKKKKPFETGMRDVIHTSLINGPV